MPRREPFDELERFLDRMTPTGDAGFGGVDVDLRDEGEEFVLVADLPGYERDDIAVSVEDRTVTVRAEREESTEVEEERYLRRERRRGAASRKVTLPAHVDETAAAATFKAGVLTVTLPKRNATDTGTQIDVE